MRRCPDDLPAGEIAGVLGLKASTTSVYLSALMQAGLITQRRDGTRLLYAVSLDAAQQVVAGLFLDCCRGRADVCPPPLAKLTGTVSKDGRRAFNVLFVCTGNSARSIFAETILRDLAGHQFNAFSAGTRHRSDLHPMAIETLVDKGHDVSHLRSKNITEFQGLDAPVLDFVITVCDRAANEDCPTWPGPPVSGHWGVPDPAKAIGSHAEKRLMFQQTYDRLRRRIDAFTSLPFDRFDRAALQKNVDGIGKDLVTQDQ